MKVDSVRDFLFRYKIHHILLWVPVFIFWREYYRLADPAKVIVANAFVCTLLEAIAFYIPYTWLVPKLLNKKGIKLFLLAIVVVMTVLVPLRSLSIYLTFQYYLPGTGYWGLFRSLSASFFHIGYAMTIGTVVRLVADKYEVQRKLDMLEKERLSGELNYLKSQVNPHFLFNIHNSIYFLIQENPAVAAEAILKLSHIMRYQLYDGAAEQVTVSQEIENIKNYIELEKMRLGNSVGVEYTDTIISGGRSLYPFILLTLVENSFKHVFHDKQAQGRIRISIEQQNDWLCLRTFNTMEPNEWNRGSNGKGIGLKNLERRLALLYDKNYSLEARKEGNAYIAQLKIKLQ
jgi:two-component system, LytTR family, sensor kinase